MLGTIQTAGAQTGVEDEANVLQQTLKAIAEAHHGKVALFARQLNTGRTVGIDPDVPVQTASVIKLTILYEAMEQVRAGKARWDEPLVLAPGDAVAGSGILTFFDAPLRLTLKDVLTMMIIVSDNTATNLAIDRLGIDAVNARIAWVGLKDTHLYKRIGSRRRVRCPRISLSSGWGRRPRARWPR